MGRYDDLIPQGGQTSQGEGRYDDLIPGARIKPTENVLQRALKIPQAALKAYTSTAPGDVFGTAPIRAMQAAKSATGEALFPDDGLAQFGFDVAADPTTYVGGGFAGKAGAKAGAKGLSQLSKVATKGRRVETVKDIGGQLLKKRWKTLPRWFERKIGQFTSKNPTETIDVSDVLKEASIQSATDPKLASTIRHPLVQNLMSDMDKARNLSLKETQELKNVFTESIPEAIKSGTKGSPRFRGTNAFTKMINQRITDKFPEMRGVAKKYGEKAEQFKQFGSSFRGPKQVEKTIGKQGVFTYFGAPDYLGGESAQSALKSFSPRAAKEIGSARRANQILNAAKIGGIGVAATQVPALSWPFRRIAEHLVD